MCIWRVKKKSQFEGFWNVAYQDRWECQELWWFEVLASFLGATALNVQSERTGSWSSGWRREAAAGATLPLAIPSRPISPTAGATEARWAAIWQSLLHWHHKRFYTLDKWIPSYLHLLFSVSRQYQVFSSTHLDAALSPEKMARPPPEAPPCAPPCAPPITPSSPGPGAHGWNQEVVCIQPSRSATPPENTEHPPPDARNVGGQLFSFMLLCMSGGEGFNLHFLCHNIQINQCFQVVTLIPISPSPEYPPWPHEGNK